MTRSKSILLDDSKGVYVHYEQARVRELLGLLLSGGAAVGDQELPVSEESALADVDVLWLSRDQSERLNDRTERKRQV